VDQAKGAGHHAITREAVHELFASGRADVSGRIDGMTEEEYFQALDKAQEHQDRPWGPTTHPAWLDGDAQRQHGMADPHHDGQWNLDTDRRYVEGQLDDAHEGGTRDTVMGHVGSAAHALEDSYSEAHAFRGQAADSGDPTAPVQSFNVFDPLPSWHMGTAGVLGTEGTHDARFDQVPVDAHGNLIRGTDQAAAHATAAMLEAYTDHEHWSMDEAHTANHGTVQRFYQADAGGVAVNDQYTASWAAERDRRLAEHRAEVANHNHPYLHPETPTEHQCNGGPCPECHDASRACVYYASHYERTDEHRVDHHACAQNHAWY
jgi:hypothetical protein